MQHDQFDTPVTVRIEASGGLLSLRSVRETSDFLLNRWPGKRTEKHRAALQACSDVENGKPAMSARRAFVAAAREAGVFADQKA